MGRREGEMESPLHRIAHRALLLPISEAEPRSVDRSRGLSWFVVPENRRMKVGMITCQAWSPLFSRSISINASIRVWNCATEKFLLSM